MEDGRGFLGKESSEGVIGKTVFEFFPRELAEQYAMVGRKLRMIEVKKYWVDSGGILAFLL